MFLLQAGTVTVYQYQGKWDARNEFYTGQWQQVATIPAAFEGTFRVFAQGETYYFLTDAGRVYASPPGKAGQPRGMTEIWGADQAPVLAAITDLAADRIYLFCKDGYFALADKLQLVPLPQGFTPADTAIATITACAKLLQGK